MDLIAKFGPLLGQVAPTIATALGGPLAGVAMTTKINTDHVPYVMDNGIAMLKDNKSTVTHKSIEGLLADGAVMLGRTNSPSFALRAHTGNDLHGETHNPHGIHLTPGGSSGGAGSAVASGMCAVAQGNDVAGSVRWPAFVTASSACVRQWVACQQVARTRTHVDYPQ